jgi:hypothetical protein
MTTITMREARALYTVGNNAGAGWEPEIDAVDDAAASMGDIVLERRTSDDVALVHVGSTLVAIGGDASGRGAWAVTIVDDRRVRSLRAEAAQAGDSTQVDICDRASEGDRNALLACALVLSDAAAQAG